MISNGSQQSSSAFCGAAAAEQLFSLHAAHLIVVVPCQLGTGPDSSASKHRQVGKSNEESLDSRLSRVAHLLVNRPLSISELLSLYNIFQT